MKQQQTDPSLEALRREAKEESPDPVYPQKEGNIFIRDGLLYRYTYVDIHR